MSSFDAMSFVGSRDADVIIQGNTTAASSNRRLTAVRIPRWVRGIFMELIGSGGGGGGGRGKAIGNLGAGGGGGASGGYSVKFVPAMMLGDVLYVIAPSGGLGGVGGSSANGSDGGAGQPSVIQLSPAPSIGARLITSQTGTSGGGNGGTNAAGGAGGTAPTASAEANAYHLARGVWVSVAGQTGAAGNTTNGADVTVVRMLTGGAGGAGNTATNQTGGDVINPTNTQIRAVAGALAGATPTYGNPGSIYQLYAQHMGGGGGNSSNSIPGGDGGNGAVGCGGGGGGAGVTTGGTGGRGGDGRVRIWWFR